VTEQIGLPASISERDFQNRVVELARLRHWLVYHTHDSRRSDPGFPDLVMVRGGVLVFAELKSQKGRTTLAQREWLLGLDGVGRTSYEVVKVHVWRPADWPQIVEVLT
jgi:hypothetical protein